MSTNSLDSDFSDTVMINTAMIDAVTIDTVTIDATEADFQQSVIEESKKRLVLVDFWAPWCAPCRSLTPVIEKLAQEYAGRFLLARVNSDENQSLAGQFGVRSIPNVKAFSDGKMVDEFAGAVPEGTVRQFIERLLPSPAEEQRRTAMQAYASGNADAALASLDAAQSLEPNNDNIRLDRAEILIDLGRSEDAEALLDELAPLAKLESRVEHLRALLTFSDTGQAEVSTDQLEARVSQNSTDLDARLALAKQYVAAKQFEPALNHLLEIIQTDRQFGEDAGRKTMLAVFELLGNEHQLTRQYRRLLAASIN
jgi:putative thioredoxin